MYFPIVIRVGKNVNNFLYLYIDICNYMFTFEILNHTKIHKSKHMQTIEMPKTYRERLEALNISESILVEGRSRTVWAVNITAMHRDTNKQFTIRTHPGTLEIRVWRLK